MSTPESQTLTTQGNGRWTPPPPGTRSSDQIRSDIVQQRQELSRSVDALRNRWIQGGVFHLSEWPCQNDLSSRHGEGSHQLCRGDASLGAALLRVAALRSA